MRENYKRGIKLLGVFSFAFLLNAKAQITFEKHYATTFDQSGKDVYPTTDGGYLIAATTENSVLNDLNVILVKTDAYGSIQTTKTYGGNQVDFPHDMCATNDGNLFVVGYSRSFGTGDQDIYLLKVEQDGDTIFTKHYGGWGNEEGKEIIPTADGNYVIVGATNSAGAGSYDIRLMKIDINGNVIWTKYYGTPQYESARSVKLCSDGGFIIAGKTAPNPTSIAKAMLVRTHPNGDTIWTKVMSGGANSWEGKSVVVNGDGSYTLAIDDSSATTDSDVRIMKLDSNGGGPIWNKAYGGTDKDIAKHIRATSDGGYVIGAISRSFWGLENVDMWIIKLDANGDSPWTRNFGTAGAHDHCHSLRTTSDGGLISIGHGRGFAPQWEIYFIKMDANGLVGISEFIADNGKLGVFPNPTDGVINIDLTGKQDFSNFTITNSLGQIVYTADMQTFRGNELMTIDIKDKDPGIYFVTIESPKQKITKKLILN